MTNNESIASSVAEADEIRVARLERDILNLNAQLAKKDGCIQLQRNIIEQQLDELKHKQRLSEEMLVFFYFFRPLIFPLMWLVRPLYKALRPRLGVLEQYPPQPLRLPSKFKGDLPLGAAPKISIVTPSFNQSVFLERTLESVFEQHYPNLEYYVQDGGSTDGTMDVLRHYESQLTGWVSAPDNGQSNAINIGFSKTSGEIMAWLNSDDILLPGTLAFVADFFSRHPDVDVIYGHRILIDQEGMEIGRWMLPHHDHNILSWADFIPQETMFWRRCIWEKAGGKIDESLNFAIDWDLLLRFRDAGAHFSRVDRFLGGFRIHPTQKTSAEKSTGFQEMSQIRERTLGRLPSKKEITRAVYPYLLKHVLIDVGWRIRSKLGLT
ncbi:MAG: glycosyltransferase family 2 protein [Rhodoferax sp.]